MLKHQKEVVKYRDHRGSLDEAMQTMQEMTSMEELVNYLKKTHGHPGPPVVLVQLQYAGYDERIDWDEWYVLIKLEGSDDLRAVGYTDGTFLHNEIQTIKS